MKLKIKWHQGSECPEKYQAQVIDDLIKTCERMTTASDLLEHVIILTDDFDGPSVYAYGDLDTLQCTYSENTPWETLNEMED
jgi:hypothetical protein